MNLNKARTIIESKVEFGTGGSPVVPGDFAVKKWRRGPHHVTQVIWRKDPEYYYVDEPTRFDPESESKCLNLLMEKLLEDGKI